MATQRYTQTQVVEAIRASRGLVSLAARRLGCARSTVEDYADRYPAVRAALAEARDQQLDVTEAKLFGAIDGGELPAILFYLRTVGRHRGYGDRAELAVSGQLAGQEPHVSADVAAALLKALANHPAARVAAADALAAFPPKGGRRPDGGLN